MQDKKGFLWIATENGLSRFDGHSFKNFTVKDGLPDNDILDIFLDSAGNVWMIPFAKNPAYVDAKTNRIVNEKVESELAKIIGKTYLLGHALKNGDVVFYDNGFSGFVFKMKDKKVLKLNIQVPNYFTIIGDDEFEVNKQSFNYYSKGVLKKTVLSPIGGLAFLRVGEEADKLLFLRADSSIIQLSDFDKNLAPKILIKKYHFRVWNIAYLKNYIGMASRNGVIYFADKQMFLLRDSIMPGAIVKNISEDSEGNFWVATDDKGIIKIGKPSAGKEVFHTEAYKDVLSLLVDSAGLISGNVSGDVLEGRFGHFTIRKVMPEKGFYNNFYIRKIIKRRGIVYLVSLQGLFFKKVSSFERIGNYNSFKDAVQVNDSMLLLGTHAGFYEFNFNTSAYKRLLFHRISTLIADERKHVYAGSNVGLYKWANNKLEPLADKNIAFANSITKLYATKDNIVWIASSSDTLMAMRNDSLLLKIPLTDISQGSICKSLGSNKPGIIWAGTDRSLVKINYTVNGRKISFSAIPFSKADGLCEGQVNDIAFFGDSVYVATTSGISKFNCNESPVIKDIPVYITQLSVNGAVVDLRDYLELNPLENNLQIEFSAIELSGFYPVFQYKINDGNWQPISENILTLSGLRSGNYTISIRALKKNLEPSSYPAILILKIKTPFFQKPLTIAALIVLSFMLGFYLLNKWKSAQQKRKQHEQLALQRQRQQFTADLHDDIGASLSSLQINSAIAAQVFDKNPGQSKEMLLKVEDQSQQLAEKIGDFIWSMKPRQDEFMTLSSRIKTYTGEILGATPIAYHLSLDYSADQMVVDFSMRKNILLIVKEALNNVAKYSQAANVFIEMKVENKTILLMVSDDGLGFSGNKTGGNGLQNMRKRAEEMKGVFEIKTMEGKGVKIFVKIPVP